VTLRSPLHDALAADGAEFAVRDGWVVATGFGDPAHEQAAASLRGLADRSARGAVAVAGRDAERLLQGLVTNDVSALVPGDACYALVLTPKGRPIADLEITRESNDRFLLLCEPPAHDALAATVRRYRLAARASIEDARERVGAIALLGRWAETPDAGGLARVETPLGPELVGPAEALAPMWTALRAAGGDPVGADAWEIARVAAGVPLLGAELDESVLPAEAGIVERAVSFEKGCFVGQEPVARLRYRGHPNRGLRRLRFDGEPPALPAALELEGRQIGRVTSVAAPAGAPAIGLGYVRREVEDGAGVLARDARGLEIEARVEGLESPAAH
jgi:folate-binding protein YgfZ